MTAHVLRHAVGRAGIDPTEVEDVVVGCGLPEGATGHNIARNAALEAGFGDAVPGMTVNRYCGSGLSAASIVANRIAAGEATIAIAAGVESISLVQFNLNLNGFFYAPLQQRMPAVWWTMNQTADFVAKKYGITREAQDAYVVQSQQRVAAAAAAGKFAEEIVSFTTTMKVTDKVTKVSHEQQVTLDRDEGPRPDTTLAGLAALKPVYPGGTTTAGNASQLSDGAGAVVMMDADLAARRGLPVLGLFRGMQLAAVAPEEMSIAIAPAIRKVVKHHQLAMADIDLWELHEAYAVTTLYNQAQLETPWETTNVNGGAVPLATRTACRGSAISVPRCSSWRAAAVAAR
jgi:acetyl-CoA C-acetyltransferase